MNYETKAQRHPHKLKYTQSMKILVTLRIMTLKIYENIIKLLQKLCMKNEKQQTHPHYNNYVRTGRSIIQEY